MRAATLLIADTQRLFSSALATALAAVGAFRVFEPKPETWLQAHNRIHQLRPEIAILDYWMPDSEMFTEDGRASQASAIRHLCEQASFCRVIVLSAVFSPSHLRSALSAGAAAFLPKNLTVREVAEAVHQVHLGAPLVYSEELFRITERLEKRLSESNRILEQFAALTPPELEVLVRRGMGHSPEAIAKELYVSRATVNARIHSILKKTGARTVAEALARARRAGLIDI